MMAVHAAPAGRNEQVHGSVAINVTQAHGIKAKRLCGDAAGVGPEQASIPARVQVGASPGNRRFAVLPGPDDQVGATVMVHVPRDGGTGAKSIACRLPGQRQKPLAGSSGMYVNPPGGESQSSVRPI